MIAASCLLGLNNEKHAGRARQFIRWLVKKRRFLKATVSPETGEKRPPRAAGALWRRRRIATVSGLSELAAKETGSENG
jgi:hypothetical protein